MSFESKARQGAFRDVVQALIAASSRRARGQARSRHGGDVADYALLKRCIKQEGLLERQYGYYLYKTALTFAFLALAIGWVLLTRTSPLLWLGPVLMAFASGQLVLLGHDAAHHAVFATSRANGLLALVAINLLNGGSYGWWTQSHNEHHARSNDQDLDPDIDYPFIAFSELQAAGKEPRFRPLLVRQHVVGFLIMGLAGLTMRLYSGTYLLKRPERRLELAAFVTYWLVYPAMLLGGLGVVRGLLFLVMHQVLFGFYVGSITSVNHWGMPMPRESHSLEFVRHQVTTSRNLAGERWVDLWFGGLNRQIEHHLFPSMPRNNLKKARPIVQRFCADRGIPYIEVGPAAAYLEMYTTLRRVARHVRDHAPQSPGGLMSDHSTLTPGGLMSEHTSQSPGAATPDHSTTTPGALDA